MSAPTFDFTAVTGGQVACEPGLLFAHTHLMDGDRLLMVYKSLLLVEQGDHFEPLRAVERFIADHGFEFYFSYLEDDPGMWGGGAELSLYGPERAA